MLRLFYKKDGKIHKETDAEAFAGLLGEDIFWVDLHSASAEEQQAVESVFAIHFQTPQQAEEIESSSRYAETENSLSINSNFLVVREEGYVNHPVSFILRDGLLFTSRNADLRSFADTVRKMKTNPHQLDTGARVLVAILETRIDLDADLIEGIARDVSTITKTLGYEQNIREDILLRITRFQETTMLVRENIVDKQRVVSAMLRSAHFPSDSYEKLRILIKDINSILEHANFSFERLEYLQNTFLGLVNIEQNKIIKIFTVVSVIFMPPTLIASVYGMNFQLMPELNWAAGYPFAIGLMVISSLGTLYLFRRKGWL